MDELRLGLTQFLEISDCCAIIFTETWFNTNIPDLAIAIERRTVIRANSIQGSGKSEGSGVTFTVKVD